MLTLYHDFTSPASAVAVLRLHRLADDGVPVAFTGFEALVDAHLPVTLEVTAGIEDLADQAAAEGLVLRRPPWLPPTARAHVVGGLADRHGLGAGWRTLCYHAFWEDGVDLADAATLVDLAAAVGLDPDHVRSCLAGPEQVTAYRRELMAHRRLGVGGVPVLLTHGTLVPALLPDDDLRALAG